MNPQKVVTRFAPSPTGYMHVGGVRTALYAYLWAKKNGGTFILRIEDTDKEREVAGSIDHIIESLKWLGITWDEGPDIGGPHAPYLQSERLQSYKKYAQILIQKGFAYPDPYTEEEVEAFRKEAEANKKPFLYRNHRPETFGVWDGTKPLRFKTPTIERKEWNDVVRGSLEAGEEALDDFILIKSDGYPTYNFAHIIDDLEMGVTHIMRADEFIASTPKFLSLYEAFGIERPQFVTLPPIMAPDGKKKLGKRDGAKDILEYRNEGYLPDAMINFLALLGWNPGTEQEIFTRNELTTAFDIARVQKSGAQMNPEKLDWINREHMKKLDSESFWKLAEGWLPTSVLPHRDMLKKIEHILRDRISTFLDIKTQFEAGEYNYFFGEPTVNEIMLVWKQLRDDPSGLEKTKGYLKEIRKRLEEVSESNWNYEGIKSALWEYAEHEGRGHVLWPFRVSLSGLEKSPDPFELASILGKETTLRRLTQ